MKYLLLLIFLLTSCTDDESINPSGIYAAYVIKHISHPFVTNIVINDITIFYFDATTYELEVEDNQNKYKLSVSAAEYDSCKDGSLIEFSANHFENK